MASSQKQINSSTQNKHSSDFGRHLFSATILTNLLPINLQQLTQANSNKALLHAQVASTIDFESQQHQLTLKNDAITSSSQQQASLPESLTATIAFEVVKNSNSVNGGIEFVKLIVKRAQRIHSTDFVCLANNKFGSDKKTIKLLVQGKLIVEWHKVLLSL